jgi:hypothetical protein
VSTKFDWDDEQDFRDIPDEVMEKSAPPVSNPPAKRSESTVQQEAQYADPGYDEEYETEEPTEEVEDFSEVLSDARLRLEQGRLYEMIMKHDLFEGVDADVKAVKNVQNEVRSFAKERMEVMLGMRQEPVYGQDNGVSFPFNSLEVDILKRLASSATKGATRSPDVEQYVATVEPTRNAIQPIGSAPRRRPAQRKEARPLPTRAPAPVKRAKASPEVEARLRSEGVEQEYIEEAKRQLANEPRPTGRRATDMTEEELIERNRLIAQRGYNQVRSTTSLPMATPEQMEAMAIQRASAASTHPSMIKLMDLLNRPSNK